jgi:hypothetical protein
MGSRGNGGHGLSVVALRGGGLLVMAKLGVVGCPMMTAVMVQQHCSLSHGLPACMCMCAGEGEF